MCIRDRAITERLSRATRRARLWIPASGGALRSRLYAAHVVREELPSEDGSIELTVELPMLELLSLARTSGVRILEVADKDVYKETGYPFIWSTASSCRGRSTPSISSSYC